jgi:hypothetical protein
MTSLPYDSDHVARGVARLIERYRKPRTSALLGSWLAEVQEVEDALWQLLVERSLATAAGVQLDVLGRIVGQPRQGRDDETYQLWISAKNMVNRSSGRTTEMLAIARALVTPADGVALEEYFPAALLIRLSGSFTLDLGYQIAYMLRKAKAAGVRFQMTWPISGASGSTFRFAPADVVAPSSPYGFDAGMFAAVADGTFIPSTPTEPAMPPGQITIQGVPLVIGGVPVVITPPVPPPPPPPPPATRPRLPVLIARQAVVVPRAQPSAALAPTPATGASIELEDAFADLSLEMSSEGDKFRVSTAIQDDLEELQDLVLDMEPSLAAMRFPFTLRTTSVADTQYEEIGVLRFDATPLAGTVLWVAELEVAVPGETAELELYNLTSGASVATMSSTSTVTQQVVASVALPLSEALYSVRLRRVGGNSAQRVSCRSVGFEGG